MRATGQWVPVLQCGGEQGIDRLAPQQGASEHRSTDSIRNQSLLAFLTMRLDSSRRGIDFRCAVWAKCRAAGNPYRRWNGLHAFHSWMGSALSLSALLWSITFTLE